MVDNALTSIAAAKLNQPSTLSQGVGGLENIARRSKQGEHLSEKDLKEVGQKFEALLLHQMLSAMRKSIPKSGLFGESSATEMYKDMFDEQIANTVAESGAAGVGDSIVRELLLQQEAARPPQGDEPVFRSLRQDNPELKPLEDRPQWSPVPRVEDPPMRPVPGGDPELKPIPGRGR